MRLVPRTAAAALGLATALVLAGCAQALPVSAPSTPAVPDTDGPGAVVPTPVETAQTAPLLRVDPVTGGTTELELDRSFVTALSGAGLAPEAIGDATVTGRTVTLPITGGAVAFYSQASGITPRLQGELDHTGSGLALVGGGQRFELQDLVVEGDAVRADVSAGGTAVADGVEVFTLDQSAIDETGVGVGGDPIFSGITVRLGDALTVLLASRLGADVPAGGVPVGSATFTVGR